MAMNYYKNSKVLIKVYCYLEVETNLILIIENCSSQKNK